MLNNCTVNFIKLGATFPRKLFLSGAGLEFAQDLEQEARNKSNIVPKMALMASLVVALCVSDGFQPPLFSSALRSALFHQLQAPLPEGRAS